MVDVDHDPLSHRPAGQQVQRQTCRQDAEELCRVHDLREALALPAQLALQLRDDLVGQRPQRHHSREVLQRREPPRLRGGHAASENGCGGAPVVVDEHQLHAGDVVAGDHRHVLPVRLLVERVLARQGRWSPALRSARDGPVQASIELVGLVLV